MDDFFGICVTICCGCCCLSCTHTDNLWCFLRSGAGPNYRVEGERGGCCTCRRAMSDDDFERTVEELYAPGKPVQYQGSNANGTHVIELQPTRSRNARGAGDNEQAQEQERGRGRGRVTTQQPTARASMEAPGRPSRDRSREPPPRFDVNLSGEDAEERERERAMLESQQGAGGRTREWVAAHTLDVPRSGSRSRSRSRSRSHSQQQRSPQGRSHRAHQSESQAHVQRPPEAHTAERGHGHRQRPSEPYMHPSNGSANGGDAGGPGEVAGFEDTMGEATRKPARLDIPASLMPGRPQSSAPTQLPFDVSATQQPQQQPHERKVSEHSQVGTAPLPAPDGAAGSGGGGGFVVGGARTE